MSIAVYTESKCDRCGLIDKESRVGAYFPSAGWSQIRLETRAEKSEGWENSAALTGQFCPPCTGFIKAAMAATRS